MPGLPPAEMVERMISHGMAFTHDPLKDCRVLPDIVANTKKGGFRSYPGKLIKYKFGRSRYRPVIEREIDYLFIGRKSPGEPGIQPGEKEGIAKEIADSHGLC